METIIAYTVVLLINLSNAQKSFNAQHMPKPAPKKAPTYIKSCFDPISCFPAEATHDKRVIFIPGKR